MDATFAHQVQRKQHLKMDQVFFYFFTHQDNRTPSPTQSTAWQMNDYRHAVVKKETWQDNDLKKNTLLVTEVQLEKYTKT